MCRRAKERPRKVKNRVASARKTTVNLLNVALQTASNAICLFKELDNDGRLPESGRKCNETLKKNVRPSKSSFRRLAKMVLRLKPYKLREVQLLTVKNKLTRLRRCQKLLRRAASQRWERFLFTDEKLFMVQQVHNSQNDRIWCVYTPSTSGIVEYSQYL
ncbi:DDE_3 domain-containing protein [Trichonephila clavipes]|nr:DDE_3 domain-containing protein [Trichonephila clavipes]